MKLYHIINGAPHVSDAPDGALLLEIGSPRPPGDDAPLPPIERINHVDGWYQRRGEARQPIPSNTVQLKDLAFRPMTAAEIAEQTALEAETTP